LRDSARRRSCSGGGRGSLGLLAYGLLEEKEDVPRKQIIWYKVSIDRIVTKRRR